MVTATNLRTEHNPTVKHWNILECLNGFPDQTVNKGTTIIEQWKRESEVIFIVEGKALLFEYATSEDKSIAIGIFNDGDFINPEILSSEVNTGRYAIAKSKVVFKAIPIVSLLNLLTRTPVLSRYVFSSIITRQKEIQKRLLGVTLMNTRRRILHFLLDYVAKAGKEVGFEKVIHHVLTQQELAGLCSASRQSVSSLLNELKDQNIIHFTRRYLLVRDLAALRKLAMVERESPATTY